MSKIVNLRLLNLRLLILRERAFAIENANNYVAVAAYGDWYKDVPKGYVGVMATLGGSRHSDAEAKWFLVKEEEYQAGNYVIKPTDKVWEIAN